MSLENMLSPWSLFIISTYNYFNLSQTWLLNVAVLNSIKSIGLVYNYRVEACGEES